MYLDLTFRCGIPDEHFPLLQEAISEAIVGMHLSKLCTASIAMSMPLPEGASQYHVTGQLVGANEVHIIPPDAQDVGDGDDPGYKNKKQREEAKNK